MDVSVEEAIAAAGLCNVSHPLMRVPRSGGVLAPEEELMAINYIGNCVTYRFVMDTVVVGSLCLLGIIGNILSIAVMQKDNCSQVATFLLQSLAIADTLVLGISYVVLSIICGLLPFLDKQTWTGRAFPYLVKYVNPLGYMAHSWCIWVTVLVAVNRFLAVSRPLGAARLCTMAKVRLQILGVLFFGIVLNIPRFFQHDIVHMRLPNSTVEVPQRNDTAIGEDTLFGKIYTNALYTICVLLLPLIILSVVNFKLIRAIQHAKRMRESMLATPTKNSKPNGEENNVTLVMIIIIVVFIICHTPDRILQIIWASFPALAPMCGTPMYYLCDAANLLIIINSSTNFVIYYFLRKRFRKILMTRICALGSSITSSSPSSWSRYRVDGNELSLLPALQLDATNKVML